MPSDVLVRVSKRKMIINHSLGNFWRIEPYPDLDTDKAWSNGTHIFIVKGLDIMQQNTHY